MPPLPSNNEWSSSVAATLLVLSNSPPTQTRSSSNSSSTASVPFSYLNQIRLHLRRPPVHDSTSFLLTNHDSHWNWGPVSMKTTIIQFDFPKLKLHVCLFWFSWLITSKCDSIHLIIFLCESLGLLYVKTCNFLIYNENDYWFLLAREKSCSLCLIQYWPNYWHLLFLERGYDLFDTDWILNLCLSWLKIAVLNWF